MKLDNGVPGGFAASGVHRAEHPFLRNARSTDPMPLNRASALSGLANGQGNGVGVW